MSKGSIRNPYSVVAKGLVLPPLHRTTIIREKSNLGITTFIYPVRIFKCNIGNDKLFECPELVFLPAHIALKVSRPVFLERIIYHSRGMCRYVLKNVLRENKEQFIAFKRLPIIDILEIKNHTSHLCVEYAVEGVECHDYVVATKVKLRGALEPGRLGLLRNLDPKSSVKIHGLSIYVGHHYDNLLSFLYSLGWALGVVDPTLRELSNVMFYARNGLFVNADELIPLFPGAECTVAYVAWRNQIVTTLVIDWSSDIREEIDTNRNNSLFMFAEIVMMDEGYEL